MPFGPWIPNHDTIPRMCPGNQKHAQGIVIEYVHSIVLDTGRYATAGGGPLGQLTASIGISDYDCEKWLVASVIGYGHASVMFDHRSLVR